MKPAEKMVALLKQFSNNPMGLASHLVDIESGVADIVNRLEALEAAEKARENK